MNDSRLVYSTGIGKISASKEKLKSTALSGDGVVRIRRETKGRKGKGVTTLSGIPVDEIALKQLLSQLKKQCGCGGALKEGVIEIQGDVREKAKLLLEAKGMQVKFAGG